MEIRLVNESAGVVGHVEIIHDPNTDLWNVIPYFDNIGEATAKTQSGPKEWAVTYGRVLVERQKLECEEDYRQRYNEEPEGVMSETGFTIQMVEDNRPTLKVEGECAREWCSNWARKDRKYCWNHGYAVTFARDNSTADLRSMSLERAKRLVVMAANCMASPGRILDVETGEEIED